MHIRPAWVLRGGALLAVVLAAAVAVLLVSSSGSDRAAGTGSTTATTVGRILPPVRVGAQTVTHIGIADVTTARPLPTGFLSLSIEYSTVPQWSGSVPGSVNPVIVRLIRALDPSGGQVIRIGGQGADRTWWPLAHVKTPLGVSDDLDSQWIRAARRLVEALNARYLLQVNLEANNRAIARVEADHFLSGLGAANIAGLEIGNEPELYRSIAWYWTEHGKPLPWYARRGTAVYARSPDYGVAQFLAQWRAYVAALPTTLAIAGPDLVGTAWMPEYADMLERGSRLADFDVHTYPLGCTESTASPRYPSVANLLSEAASRDLLGVSEQYIARAHAAGAKFVDDELGSVSCGGKAGVSDSMASALWVLDTLFAMDQAGVDGVDLHDLPNTVNALFDLEPGQATRILPMYLGALLFAQAAPAGSQLLSVTDSDEADLRAWATRGSDGTTRIVLINDGASRVVSIDAPSTPGVGLATLERLHAHGAASTSGFMLGGRPVTTTSTGDLQPAQTERVQRRHGHYEFEISSGSAAMLTLPAQAGAGA